MYCGIDVAKGKSQVCILDDNKEVINEFEIKHNKQGVELLESNLKPDTIIGIEATGVYCKALFDYLRNRYEIYYVDNHQMYNFARLHFADIKNDKIDAKLIAKYLTYDLKKFIPAKFDALYDLSKLYQKTVKEKVRYRLMFRSQAQIIFPELEEGTYLTRGTGILYLLQDHPNPESILKIDSQALLDKIRIHFKTNAGFNLKLIENIKAMARRSIGIKNYPTTYFQYTIKLILFYDKLLKDIEEEMRNHLKETPYYNLLDKTGYSLKSLSAIVGQVQDIRRFKTHKKFVSYCGLDISEKQSGSSLSKNAYITKHGNSVLRYTFYMLTLGQLRTKNEISDFFKSLKERGKHGKKAMTAASRKFAVKCYFDMMKCHE